MSGNPFDDFASEMRAAIPAPPTGVPESAPPTSSSSSSSSSAAAGKPMVMNTFAPPPVATGYPAPYMMQPPAPPMGYPPATGTPPMMMTMMQQQQQQQLQSAPPMGYPPAPIPPHMGGMMMPPPPSQPHAYSWPPAPGVSTTAMVPSPLPPSNPYASMLGGPPAYGGTTGLPPPPAAGRMMPPPAAPYGMAPPPPPTLTPPAPPMGYPMPSPPVPAPVAAGGGGGSALFDPLSAHDPWGAPVTVPPHGHSNNTQAVAHYSGGGSEDPFGVFGSGGPPPPPHQPPAVSSSYPTHTMAPSIVDEDDGPVGGGGGGYATSHPPSMTQNQILSAVDDFWGDMGFTPAPVHSSTSLTYSSTTLTTVGDGSASAGGGAGPGSLSTLPTSNRKLGELPPGGEWYDARIFTPTLGVMFFKPKELVDSLFLQTEPELVEALEERPVVAFIVEGSSARSAGVELGHVLLKVNGIDVKNPKEASRLIKEGPRPLPLLFYVPDTTVVVAEGEHMVKYDTRDTGAPNSAKDWKPKYVVIGGIIAQPWMMNMYRSKSEYDIAVIETQARRPVSVKVKQFSLQGARLLNDWQGPQVVKYKNKLHPWKYVVVMPVGRNPIKISAENLTQLKPVHEGIRRVMAAQQRNAPSGAGGGMTRVDPYGRPYAEEDPNNNPPNYYNTQAQITQPTQQPMAQQQYSNYPSNQPYQYPNDGNSNVVSDQPNGISGGTSSVRRRQQQDHA